MSNTRKPSKPTTTADDVLAETPAPTRKVHSVQKYIDEARVDPFVLGLPDGTELEIEGPTGASLNLFGQAASTGDVDAMLVALCGDAYPAVRDVFDHAGYTATVAVLEDMLGHFGLDNGATEVTLQGPGGGTVRESDPRKIEALLKRGWKLGE